MIEQAGIRSDFGAIGRIGKRRDRFGRYFILGLFPALGYLQLEHADLMLEVNGGAGIDRRAAATDQQNENKADEQQLLNARFAC